MLAINIYVPSPMGNIQVTEEIGGDNFIADATVVIVDCPRGFKSRLDIIASRLNEFATHTGVEIVTESFDGVTRATIAGIPPGYAWHYGYLVFRALVGRQVPKAGGLGPMISVAHAFVTQFLACLGDEAGKASVIARSGNRGQWQTAEGFTDVIEPILIRADIIPPVYIARAPGAGRPRKAG